MDRIIHKPMMLGRKTILLLVVSIICIACNSHPERISYDIPTVDASIMQEIADSSSYEYTAFTTYSKYCDFCQEDFPKVFAFCKTLPIDLYVLFSDNPITSGNSSMISCLVF